ncbi:MAG TPA: AMP-binding protein, partial [Pyrinomonadaceae bacterium]|nr:AMP-binding protein [Pyrinomonadaceae bacterium]
MNFRARTLVELLAHRADAEPERVAYTFLADGEAEEIRLSYAGLHERAQAVAAMLGGHVKRGERVLLLYPPGLEFISAFFGCLYAGVVAVPAYPPRLNQNLLRLQVIAAGAGAEVALTTAQVKARVHPLCAADPHLRDVRWLATDEQEAVGQVESAGPQASADDL